MKKRMALLLAFALGVSALAGCGGSETAATEEENKEIAVEIHEEKIPVETGTEAETEPVAEDEVEEKVLSVITEREVVDGKKQSYLTGEWKAEEVVNRRPVAVMIPNNKPAMPQYGISQASIIYEAPVEGRITRLLAVVEDYDDLDRIGPVRSARDYFVYTAMGYQAFYCNWGLARPYVEELINRDTVSNISAAVAGINKPADEAYGRVDRPGYATEFTGYLFLNGVKKAVDRLGYEWNYDETYVPQFTFVTEDNRAEYADEADVTVIRPGGTEANKGGYGSYNPYFKYNEEDHLYYRYQAGAPQIDEMNGEQLAVSNVVLQYCVGEVRDEKDYLAFGVHGTGTALVFTNGKVIPAYWTRLEGDGVPAKFFDADGNEIIFNQGKTWICNIWEEYAEHVIWE